MDEYLTWIIQEVTPWHWWVLGVIMLGIEMLTGTMYLLFPAVSAGVMGFLILAFPDLDWRIQLLIYVPLSIVTTMLWRRWWQSRDLEHDMSSLNRVGQQLKGRVVSLIEPTSGREGRARLGDSVWSVRLTEGPDLPEAAQVEIIDIDSTTLIVRPWRSEG